MQTRSSDENSVRLSVCLSVCPSVKRVHCDKTEEKSIQFLYHTKHYLAYSFLRRIVVGGGRPLLPEIMGQSNALERNRRFQSTFTPSASAVTPSEKVQLTVIGSPLRAF